MPDHQTPPSANRTVPSAPTRPGPKRAPRRAPGIAVSAAIAGPGEIISPAVRIGSRHTPVRNSTLASSIPANAGEEQQRSERGGAEGAHRQQLRARRSARGDGGCAARAARAEVTRARAGTGSGRSPSPTAALHDRHRQRGHAGGEDNRAQQIGSGAMASGWRISRSTRRPAIRPAMPTGTLTMNTHLHPACTSSPPRGGPAAAAIPPTAAHAPIAMWPLLGGELGQQQSERGRHQQRRAQTLNRARAHEERDRGRRGACGRGGNEQADAEQERAPAPEPVRPAPRDDQERGEHDRVGVQDPRQRRQARAREVGVDLGECDVDDEHVQAGHEHADDDDHQNLPSALHQSLLSCRIDGVTRRPVVAMKKRHSAGLIRPIWVS